MPILLATDEVSNELACRPVTAALGLRIDKCLEFFGERHVHRAHASDGSGLGKVCQGRFDTSALRPLRRLGGSGEDADAAGAYQQPDDDQHDTPQVLLNVLTRRLPSPEVCDRLWGRTMRSFEHDAGGTVDGPRGQRVHRDHLAHLKVIERLKPSDSGSFQSYDGRKMLW